MKTGPLFFNPCKGKFLFEKILFWASHVAEKWDVSSDNEYEYDLIYSDGLRNLFKDCSILNLTKSKPTSFSNTQTMSNNKKFQSNTHKSDTKIAPKKKQNKKLDH